MGWGVCGWVGVCGGGGGGGRPGWAPVVMEGGMLGNEPPPPEAPAAIEEGVGAYALDTLTGLTDSFSPSEMSVLKSVL